MQNNQHLDDEEKPVEVKIYNQQDLLQFQNANMYSSIGRMVLSSMTSAPTVGFGTADRKKQAKIFQSKELCKTQFVGIITIFCRFIYINLQEKHLQALIMKFVIVTNSTILKIPNGLSASL